MADLTTFGCRLKELRTLFGFSQADVATLLGIDRSAYCCYEINRSKPDIYNLARLATLYKVSIDYLVFGNDAEERADKSSIDKAQSISPTTLSEENMLTLSDRERALIAQFRVLPDRVRDDTYHDVQQRCREYLQDDNGHFSFNQ